MSNGQRSQFWDTASSLGDGNDTYSAAQWREMARALWTPDRAASEGVLAGIGGGLAVSGASSPVSVAAGAALVSGILYQNTTALSLAVPTPSNGTTRHRVVLQAAWGSSKQTVRAALISSADGSSSSPALTQQDNSQWEIPLAGLLVTTGGAITIEDQRDYAHMAHALLYRRQGGSAANWSSAGANPYRVGGARVQSGAVWMEWDGDNESDDCTLTFPQAFSQPPLVYVTLISAGVANAVRCRVAAHEISASGCELRGYRTDGSDWSQLLRVQWLAIGPR